MADWVLFTDGGSRGNPGKSGLGFFLSNGAEEIRGGWYIPHATNNVAEYSALIWGLQNAREVGAEKLEIRCDSELLVKQINGQYRVKNESLKPLYQQAKELIRIFGSVDIAHVYREDNSVADALANEAMDKETSIGDYRVAWEYQPISLFEFSDSPKAEQPSTITEIKNEDTVENYERHFEMKDSSEIDRNPDSFEEGTLSGRTFSDTAGVYELTVKDHFDAAHTLPGYPGPCRYLHGHTWDVEATIEGMKLNGIDILYDFKDIKRDIASILDNFDHRYINDVKPFDSISPTAENMARVIYYELAAMLPDGVCLKEVAVWESPQARLAYRPMTN